MPFENNPPRLYTSLAAWFHLLSAPSDYAEEAEFARRTLVDACSYPIQTVLELGSGGGNNASHLKRSFQMTLTDASPEMLQLSQGLNPECEHILGDMRNVRLEREFDAVFIHDAVMYLTTLSELRKCLETAFLHCKPGGVTLIMPDYVAETFRSGVHHGGHDADGRGMRYLEWTFDTDPGDTTYTTDFVYLLREGNSPVKVEHDCHVMGLFPKDAWLKLLMDLGFAARPIDDPYGRLVFVCCRRGL